MLDPTPKEITSEVSDKTNYELAIKNALELRKKLSDAVVEKEDLLK